MDPRSEADVFPSRPYIPLIFTSDHTQTRKYKRSERTSIQTVSDQDCHLTLTFTVHSEDSTPPISSPHGKRYKRRRKDGRPTMVL